MRWLIFTLYWASCFICLICVVRGNNNSLPGIYWPYESHSRVVNKLLNTSYFVDEYAYTNARYLRILNRQSSSENMFLINYVNRNVLHIKGNSCVADDWLPQYPEHNKVFASTFLQQKGKIMSVMALLFEITYENDANLTFAGSQIILGQPVNNWISYYQDVIVNSSWSASGEVPVSLTAKGFFQGVAVDLEVEFLSVTNPQLPIDLFQTPFGFACTNRTQTEISDYPDTSRSSITTFHQETIEGNSSFKTIKNSQLMLNPNFKLTVFESVLPGDTTPTLHVNDYNTGIQFFISKNTGQCSMQPIPSDFTNKEVTHALTMKSRSEILMLDKLYAFVSSDNFDFLTRSFYISDGPESDYVTSLFLKRQTSLTISALVTQLEIQSKATSGSMKNKTSHNLFYVFPTFRLSDTWKKMSNVFGCGEKDSQKELTLSFKTSISTLTCYYYKEIMFEKILSFIIYRLQPAGVSPMRVTKPKLHHNVTHLLFTITLLPPFDAQNQFQQLPKQPSLQRKSDIVSSNSSAECKQLCANYQKFVCQSFLIKREHCLLYDDIYQDSDSGDASYFARVVRVSQPQLSMKEALKILQERGRFSLDLSSRIVAVTYEGYRDSSQPNAKSINANLELFVEMENQIIETTNTAAENVNLDTCTNMCLSDMNCASFSHNHLTNACGLSKYDPIANPERLTFANNTRVFIKNRLMQFRQPTERTTGRRGVNVATKNECAKLCLSQCSENACDCEQMEICSEGNAFTCLTGAGSITKQQIKCEVYSREFDKGFQPTFVRRVSVKKLHFERHNYNSNCARLCIMKFGNQCKGYFREEEFQPICGFVLAGESEFDFDGDDVNCVYFKRVFQLDGTPYQPIRKVGLSTGLVIGLVIGFFVLGVLLAILIIAGWNRSNSRRKTNHAYK